MQNQQIKKGKKSLYLIFGAVLEQVGLLLKYSVKIGRVFALAEIAVDSEQQNYLSRH